MIEHVTIGIDPGKTSGVGLLVGGRLAAHRRVANLDTDDIERRVRVVHELYTSAGLAMERGRAVRPVWGGVEAQFLGAPQGGKDAGKRGAAGMATAMVSVAEGAAVWRAALRLVGVRLMESPLPSQWRATFNLNRRGIDDRKAAAQAVVSTHFGIALDADRCEAILIATHLHTSRHHGDLPDGLEWVRTLRIRDRTREART